MTNSMVTSETKPIYISPVAVRRVIGKKQAPSKRDESSEKSRQPRSKDKNEGKRKLYFDLVQNKGTCNLKSI